MRESLKGDISSIDASLRSWKTSSMLDVVSLDTHRFFARLADVKTWIGLPGGETDFDSRHS